MKKIFVILLTCLAVGNVWAQKEMGEGSLAGTTLNMRASAKSVALLRSGADGLGFYSNVSATTIRANNAYLPEGKQMLIDLSTLDAPITNISETEMEKGKSSDGKCFDLNGRPVSKRQSHKGVIVQDNKKFVVKP